MRLPLPAILRSDAPAAVLLVRLAVGLVFLSEGVQKWIRPEDVGAGRFAQIGIPWPEVMGPFVGTAEIVCGVLVLVGLFARLAAVPLLAVMSVAIVSTKIPILIGSGYWIFSGPSRGLGGFWDMAHESRTDFAMTMGALFLALVGAGPISLDARLLGRTRARTRVSSAAVNDRRDPELR